MTTLAVVIPTLNEAGSLPDLLGDLTRLPIPHEVVVADGGSWDGTVEAARERGARVVSSAPGRAWQLNAGAQACRAPWILFLHADVRLGPEARAALAGWLRDARPDTAAAFRFRLQGTERYWRLVEMGQRLRARLLPLPFGDQGLLVSRKLFRAVGGYPEVPLLEDVALARLLRARGRLVLLRASVAASPRRYRREGRVRVPLRNNLLLLLYLAGVPPARLARWHRPRSGPGAVLLLLVKAPEPGRVKTRLARELGEKRAVSLYRELGRRVFRQVREGPYRLVVVYDPPGAEASIRAWLGPGAGVELRPQGEGDLGARLARAFGEAFREGAGAVCAIGADAPGVDREVVSRALEALRGADVVLGPAVDGGYYLIGLRRPVPELFRGIPWGTDRVLAGTRRRIRELGLRAVELEPLRDVDRAADLAPLSLSLPGGEGRIHIG